MENGGKAEDRTESKSRLAVGWEKEKERRTGEKLWGCQGRKMEISGEGDMGENQLFPASPGKSPAHNNQVIS